MKKIPTAIGIFMMLAGIACDRHNSLLLSIVYLGLFILGILIVYTFWERDTN